MTVKHVIRDAALRTLTTIAMRRGIHIAVRFGRYVLGSVGTQACHEEAINLLREWAKWAPVAEDTEGLLVKTLTVIRAHSSPGDFDIMDVLDLKTTDNDHAGAPAEPTVSDKPMPTERSTTTGG